MGQSRKGELQNEKFKEKKVPISEIDSVYSKCTQILKFVCKEMKGLRNGIKRVVASRLDPTELNFQLIKMN